jgi:hypothetical protein
MFRPKSDADGGVLNVIRGTKGGRGRVNQARTEYQRDVLRRAAEMAGNGSMMPPEYNLKKWESHYNWVMHREQITRKGLGITSHGLRHEYAHERYEDRLGVEPPVKGGGKPGMDTGDIDTQKRLLSHELGHSRPGIIGCYSGSPKPSAKGKGTGPAGAGIGGMETAASGVSGMESMASVTNEGL